MSYKVFDEHAVDYDSWFIRNRIIVENELATIRMLGEPRPPSMELGVGTGFYASKIGVEYGVDPALNPLLIARDRGITVIRGAGENIPFRNTFFHTIYLVVTICFLEDPVTVLQEARRVLRREGRLITCFIPADSSWGRYYLEKRSQGKSIFYEKARFYTRMRVKMFLEDAGFQITGVSSSLFFSPWEKPVLERPRFSPDGSFVCYASVPTGK